MLGHYLIIFILSFQISLGYFQIFTTDKDDVTETIPTNEPTDPTENTEETTITTATPEPDNEDCVDGESKIIKKDLHFLIKNIEQKLNISEKIIYTFRGTGQALVETYKGKITRFRKTASSHVDHLKDVLDGIANVRKIKEPVVDQIVKEIKIIYISKKKYEDIMFNYKKALSEFEKSKKICEMFCNDDRVPRYLQHSNVSIRKHENEDDETFICTNLEYASNIIKIEFQNIQQKLVEEYTERFNNQKKTYENAFETIKKNVKEVSLQRFGQGYMWDILNLLDDYSHFYEDIQTTHSKIEDIETYLLAVETKLFELQGLVKKYKSYCFSCSNPLVRFAGYTPYEHQNAVKQSDAESVIIQAVGDEANLIMQGIDNTFNETFKDMEKFMNVTEFVEIVVGELDKKAQDEIKKPYNTEKDAFEELKQKVPKSDIEEILDIKESLTVMKNVIEEVIALIKKYLPS